MKKLIPVLMMLVLLCASSTPALASGNVSSGGVDPFRGAWGGTLTHKSPDGIIDAQLNLYFNESVPGDEPGYFKASGYASITWEEPDKPKRAKATLLPMMAKYIDIGDGTFNITILATFPLPPWAHITGASIYKLEGTATIPGSGVADNVMQGMWYTKIPNGNIVSDLWSVVHLDRRNVKAPEISLDDPTYNLYMVADTYAHILPNDSGYGFEGTTLELRRTNIVSDSVRVGLPSGDSVIIPQYTDVYSLDVDFLTSFRFVESLPGLPEAGGTYTYTLLNVLGQPIPGVTRSDVYVGGYIPERPTDVNAMIESGGILVSWAPASVIPGSFDPPSGIGFYQITVLKVGMGDVFGANWIADNNHLIPNTTGLFGPHDYGTAIGDLDDGTYAVNVASFSQAPQGSAGYELEAAASCYGEEQWIFDIENGSVVNCINRNNLIKVD